MIFLFIIMAFYLGFILGRITDRRPYTLQQALDDAQRE